VAAREVLIAALNRRLYPGHGNEGNGLGVSGRRGGGGEAECSSELEDWFSGGVTVPGISMVKRTGFVVSPVNRHHRDLRNREKLLEVEHF